MWKILFLGIFASSFFLSLGTDANVDEDEEYLCFEEEFGKNDKDTNLKYKYEKNTEYEYKNDDSDAEYKYEKDSEYKYNSDSDESDESDEDKNSDEDNDFYEESKDNKSEYQDYCPGAIKRFERAVLLASSRMLKTYYETQSTGTSLISPLAIIYLAGGFALFAFGETKRITFDLAGLKSTDEFSCVFRTINQNIANLPKYVDFYQATNYFGNIQYQFTDRFMSDILVGAGINIDMSDSKEAAEFINNKIAADTDNNILNIIENCNILNRSTEIVVTSASFLSTPWQIEFEISQDVKEFFVAPGKSIPETFYYQKAVYNYAYSSELESQVIQLYTKGKYFNIIAILPKQRFRIDKVIDKIAENPTGWYYKIRKQFKPTVVKVTIPVNVTTSLNSRALAMAATDLDVLMSRETIQLKGVVKGNKPASVSVGRQKNRLQAPPSGGPVPKLPRYGKTVEFTSNYPSVFFVCYGDLVVYVGVVNGPTYEKNDNFECCLEFEA